MSGITVLIDSAGSDELAKKALDHSRKSYESKVKVEHLEENKPVKPSPVKKIQAKVKKANNNIRSKVPG